MESKFNENSRKKLIGEVRKAVTKMMEQALDFAHVACPVDNFTQLRSKILRAGNDCMRTLEKEMTAYDVTYKRMTEEIIEFNQHK